MGDFNLVQFDSHPRGYGSIVNFESDLGKVNFGMTYDEIQKIVKNREGGWVLVKRKI